MYGLCLVLFLAFHGKTFGEICLGCGIGECIGGNERYLDELTGIMM